MEKENYSLQEVADKLGCSKKTVQRIVESGKLKTYTLAGGTKQYIKDSDLKEFIKNNQNISTNTKPEQLSKQPLDKKEELFKKLWSLATRLRGQMEGWDFKNYILGMMFYRYISEHFAKVINEYQGDGFKYEEFSDEDALNGKDLLIQDYGYFLAPSELFCNVFKNAESNSDLNITLDTVFKNIESSLL